MQPSFAFFIFTMGIVSTKKNILSRLGTYSIYIYILHLFVVVFIRTLDKHYGLMDRINTNVTMSVFCAASILLAFVLVSRPIRKMTEWFIEPHKRILKQNHERHNIVKGAQKPLLKSQSHCIPFITPHFCLHSSCYSQYTHARFNNYSTGTRLSCVSCRRNGNLTRKCLKFSCCFRISVVHTLISFTRSLKLFCPSIMPPKKIRRWLFSHPPTNFSQFILQFVKVFSKQIKFFKTFSIIYMNTIDSDFSQYPLNYSFLKSFDILHIYDNIWYIQKQGRTNHAEKKEGYITDSNNLKIQKKL